MLFLLASATKSPGVEVDPWQQAHDQLAPAARERWEVGEVRTIYQAVMPGLDPAEFQMVMAMAARYDLDPLAHEIWGAKGKTRDGRPGRVLILVGRDGLLKVARRDATYAGFDSDVVHEKDTFRVKRSGAGREIIHEYEGGTKDRGPIIGAWAQVYQKGYHDTYFFAPWEEYFPNRADDKSPWTKQPSVMIQKCALSLCLRLAFNLSGVVSEEEGARAFEDDVASAAESEDSLSAAVAEISPDLRDRLYAAYGEAAHLRPGQMTPASVEMSVKGQSRERIVAYLDEAEEANAAVRSRAEARSADDAISDAEVVEPDVPADASDLPDLSGEEPTASVSSPTPDGGSAPIAPGMALAAQEHLDVLHRRLSDLTDRQADLDPESADAELVTEEVATIEAEIREVGGTLPGQESFDV
jgi:phage recombination protein Bet